MVKAAMAARVLINKVSAVHPIKRPAGNAHNSVAGVPIVAPVVADASPVDMMKMMIAMNAAMMRNADVVSARMGFQNARNLIAHRPRVVAQC